MNIFVNTRKCHIKKATSFAGNGYLLVFIITIILVCYLVVISILILLFDKTKRMRLIMTEMDLIQLSSLAFLSIV